MTENMENVEAVDNSEVPLDLGRITASILKTVGPVEVPFKNVAEDFSNMQILVSAHQESETVVFELVPMEEETNEAPDA